MLGLVVRIDRDTRLVPAAQEDLRDGQRRNRLVMMMAGGTGGHVYPALAVAAELLVTRVPSGVDRHRTRS